MDIGRVALTNVNLEDKARLEEKGFAEVVFRKGKGQIEAIKKIAIEYLKDEQKKPVDISVMAKAGLSLQVVNLVATVAGTVIICNKLNQVDRKLDQVRKDVADLKDINFEIQIAKPCRDLLQDYKVLSNKLIKNRPIEEDEFVSLIRGLNGYLITLYNLAGKLPLDTTLELILMLLPVYTNCITIYYQKFYDVDQGKHVLHDDWMSIFDLLTTESFLTTLQDYLFVEKHVTNKDTNEYLYTYHMAVSDMKQKIEQLLQDIEICEGTSGYEEAMQWSRQYAEQQAKAIQSELEAEYGMENVQPVMEKVLRETLW